MLWTPRDDQQAGIDDIVSSLLAGLNGGYKSPTGSGKSLILAGVLERLPEAWCIVPSIEIAIGIYKACGLGDISEESEKTQRSLTEAARIVTSIRAKKLLESGVKAPKYLLYDEGHHGTDATHDGIRALCGSPPIAVLSATLFRGTPQGTGELMKLIDGRITTILGEKESVERGYTCLPEFSTVPLLDDETIDVSNGEFVVKSVESSLRTRIDQLAELIQGEYDGQRFRSPTTVVLPSSDSCDWVRQILEDRGVPSEVVLAGTKGRQRIFKRTVDCESVLLQMRVVGEGVDLPLRCMIDIAPTFSPVLWMQRVGRIRRPLGGVCCLCGHHNPRPYVFIPENPQVCMKCQRRTVYQELPSRYLSCCHNLLRHGYLFEGLIPAATMSLARSVWGADWKPSRRMMSRALGLQGFGRFLPVEVPLSDDRGAVWMYAMKKGLVSYAALLIPGEVEPKYFVREDVYTGQIGSFEKNGHTIEYKMKDQGVWVKVKQLPDVKGCVSYPPENMKPSDARTWNRKAADWGLDAEYVPSAKEYLLLPILQGSRIKL